jgi:hypothetical protein
MVVASSNGNTQGGKVPTAAQSRTRRKMPTGSRGDRDHAPRSYPRTRPLYPRLA